MMKQTNKFVKLTPLKTQVQKFQLQSKKSQLNYDNCNESNEKCNLF